MNQPGAPSGRWRLTRGRELNPVPDRSRYQLERTGHPMIRRLVMHSTEAVRFLVLALEDEAPALLRRTLLRG
jgi:hypothetical protein